MTNNVHLSAKFSNNKEALPISANGRIKDVVYFNENTIHIPCKTTDPTPYRFTICINNAMSPFSTLYFLKSLNGSIYETLVKDIKADIDKKLWQTKEGLPLRACAIA